jgi:hypothetical protein
MSRVTHLLNQTATRYPKGGFDLYGKPTVAAGVDFSVRAEPASERLVNQQGSEYMIDTRLFIEPDQAMELEDKITIGSDIYKVEKVEVMYAGDGTISHKEVLVKRTKE